MNKDKTITDMRIAFGDVILTKTETRAFHTVLSEFEKGVREKAIVKERERIILRIDELLNFIEQEEDRIDEMDLFELQEHFIDCLLELKHRVEEQKEEK